jgi:hypothetical protein
MWGKRSGFNPKILQKYLWGPYYFSQKKKKISKKPFHSTQKEMFVEFVLNTLVKEYSTVDPNMSSKESRSKYIVSVLMLIVKS